MYIIKYNSSYLIVGVNKELYGFPKKAPKPKNLTIVFSITINATTINPVIFVIKIFVFF